MRNENARESSAKAGIRGVTSIDVPIEVPIGGWNTRDAQDNIPPQDAIIMDNWIPGLGEVAVRKGQTVYGTTGVPGREVGTVGTLAVFNSGSSNKMIACEGDAIFDISAAGPGVALELNGITIGSDVFDFTNFRGSGVYENQGQLILCNGDNKPLVYDGTDINEVTLPLNGTHWDVGDVPLGCHSFKNRMYYWRASDQSIFYTELYAPGGVIYRFPLGSVGQFGGQLIGMYTWTHDGGSGPDDYAVFVMSSGEVLVYQGDYPGSYANWALIGIYNIGNPLHSRGVIKFGGDLIIMTDLDFVFLSNAILGTEANKNLTKISGAVQDAAANIGQFGWDAVMYPLRKYLIFNIPHALGYHQFVMNTITGAWCRLLGFDASCWVEYNGDMYFGSEGGVIYKAFQGNVDETATWIGDPPEFDYVYSLISSVDGVHGTVVDEIGTFGTITVSALNRYGDRVIFIGDVHNGDQLRVEIDEFNYIVYDLTSNPLWSVDNENYFTIQATINDADGTISQDDNISLILLSISDVYVYKEIPIDAEIQTSWMNFNSIENKVFQAIKMFFRCAVDVLYNASYAVDFGVFKHLEFLPSDDVSETIWGDPWGSPWSSSSTVSERWEMISGYGRVVSMKMKVSMKSSLSWELSIWHIGQGGAL